MRVQPKGADPARSDGEYAAELAAGYGLTADDWQEDVEIDWLLLDGEGRWLSRTCGLAVPRQNGKNAAIEIRELYGTVELGEKFLHTAHEVKTARKAFKRLKHFFGEHPGDVNAKFPELNALVKEIRSTNGQEAILLHHRDCPHFDGHACRCDETGGSVEFVARSKGSGRGFTVDVLVCDEAQDLTDEELQALLSTTSSAPSGNPQLIVTGTPPDPEKGETGEVFMRVRLDGEPHDDDGELLEPLDDFLAWTDFGVADGPLEDVDLDSLALLKACNPAMRTGRLLMATIRTEMRRLSRAGLARERFGWWGNLRAGKNPDGVFRGWRKRGDPSLTPPATLAVGLAVSFDREWSSIAAAGRLDEEQTYLGAVRRDADSWWLVDAAAELQDETGCAVVISAKGPGAGLIPKLEERGVDVTVVNVEDALDAAEGLADAVKDATVTHGAFAELDGAVAATVARKIGERWTLDRLRPTDDVSMAEAAMLAHWGVTSALPASVSVHGFGNLELCDLCGERPHEDPDGEHEYRCPDCREEV